MYKTFKTAWMVFRIFYKANGFAAIFDLVGQVYTSTLYPLLEIYLLAKLLDMLTKNSGLAIYQLIPMGLIFIAGSLVRSIFANFQGARGVLMDFTTTNYLYLQMTKKLAVLDTGVLENPQFQKLLSLNEGMYGTMSGFYLRLISFIDAVVKFLTGALIVSAAFPVFVPIILFAAIPSFFVLNKYREKTWPFFTTKWSSLWRLTQYVKTLLSSDSTSKETAIFKNAQGLTAKIKHHQDIYIRGFKKAIDSEMAQVILADFIVFFAFFYTQYLNLAKALAGKLSIGQFTLYFQQTLNMATGASLILDNYSSMSMRIKFLDNYFEFMNTQPSIISPKNPLPFLTHPNPAVVEFKNVSFKYPKTERWILKKFNLKIKSGERIALVGENGAGKTTIIKLLLRFYDVTDGEILLNGINIKDVDLALWHKQVGALFQDFIKYQFTFRENIEFGNLEGKGNKELFLQALRQSGADGLLKDLPDKEDQIVGKMFENGIDLSGGQWQKLALARAYFRNAPFLILDEPTSAIDAKAEYEIFQNAQKLQDQDFRLE